MGLRRSTARLLWPAGGVLLIIVGVSLAGLSDPRRYSLDPRWDRVIDTFALSGLALTLGGIVLLLTASRYTAASLPPGTQAKVNWGVGGGFLLQLTGFVLAGMCGLLLPGIVLIVASLPPFVWGCTEYAAGKGYSRAVGLVSLLGIPGLIVLILLPARQDRLPASQTRNEPRE